MKLKEAQQRRTSPQKTTQRCRTSSWSDTLIGACSMVVLAFSPPA
jgi:hypothetical protein